MRNPASIPAGRSQFAGATAPVSAALPGRFLPKPTGPAHSFAARGRLLVDAHTGSPGAVSDTPGYPVPQQEGCSPSLARRRPDQRPEVVRVTGQDGVLSESGRDNGRCDRLRDLVVILKLKPVVVDQCSAPSKAAAPLVFEP